MNEIRTQLQSGCSRESVNKESPPSENFKRKYDIVDDLDLTISPPKLSKTSNMQIKGKERLAMKTFVDSQVSLVL